MFEYRKTSVIYVTRSLLKLVHHYKCDTFNLKTVFLTVCESTDDWIDKRQQSFFLTDGVVWILFCLKTLVSREIGELKLCLGKILFNN